MRPDIVKTSCRVTSVFRDVTTKHNLPLHNVDYHVRSPLGSCLFYCGITTRRRQHRDIRRISQHPHNEINCKTFNVASQRVTILESRYTANYKEGACQPLIPAVVYVSGPDPFFGHKPHHSDQTKFEKWV